MKFVWVAIVLLAVVVVFLPTKGTTIIEDAAQNGALGSVPIIQEPPRGQPLPEPEPEPDVQPQLDPETPRRWRRGRPGRPGRPGCPAPSKWRRRVGFG